MSDNKAEDLAQKSDFPIFIEPQYYSANEKYMDYFMKKYNLTSDNFIQSKSNEISKEKFSNKWNAIRQEFIAWSLLTKFDCFSKIFHEKHPKHLRK